MLIVSVNNKKTFLTKSTIIPHCFVHLDSSTMEDNIKMMVHDHLASLYISKCYSVAIWYITMVSLQYCFLSLRQELVWSVPYIKHRNKIVVHFDFDIDIAALAKFYCTICSKQLFQSLKETLDNLSSRFTWHTEQNVETVVCFLA